MNLLLASLLILQSNSATGSIGGTVVQAGTSLQTPLESARVELSAGTGLPVVVRTDARGGFAFANLLPGSYQLRVTKDGFLRQEFAHRASIVIKPDSPHKPVVFELEVAPTIGGRVMSDNGAPLGNIMVSALRFVYGPTGKRTFKAEASALTDERGEYRLYWLDPGEYVIRANFLPPPIKTLGRPANLVPRSPYASIYFPGATDLANAQRVPLRADQNLLRMDFRLPRAALASVRGTATLRSPSHGSDPAPINTIVTLAMAGLAGATPYAAKTNELGDFEIVNIPPGDYIASAETMVGRQRYAAAVRVVIRDRDENNVGLVMSPGMETLGRIALESGAPMDWAAVHVRLTPVDPDLESFSTAEVQADGQFAIRNVQPGTYSIDVSGIPRDLYSKEERSGTLNLKTSLLEIAWDFPAPLQIIIGVDAGRMEGTVVDPHGQSFAGAQVVLVPNIERRDQPGQHWHLR